MKLLLLEVIVLNIVLEHLLQPHAVLDNVQIIPQPQRMMSVKLSCQDVLLNLKEVALLDQQEPVPNNKEQLHHVLLLVEVYKFLQFGPKLDAQNMMLAKLGYVQIKQVLNQLKIVQITNQLVDS